MGFNVFKLSCESRDSVWTDDVELRSNFKILALFVDFV